MLQIASHVQKALTDVHKSLYYQTFAATVAKLEEIIKPYVHRALGGDKKDLQILECLVQHGWEVPSSTAQAGAQHEQAVALAAGTSKQTATNVALAAVQPTNTAPTGAQLMPGDARYSEQSVTTPLNHTHTRARTCGCCKT